MPKIIKSRLIPRLCEIGPDVEVHGVALYPFIFIHPDHYTEDVILHERIHCEQYKETCCFGYFFIATYDFIKNFFKCKNLDESYRNVRFEKEAYANMSNPDYLQERKRYNWVKL